MKCPRDETTLRPVHLRGTTFDSCPTCRGRWLDRGELERMVLGATRVRTSLEGVVGSRQQLERPILFRAERDADMACPRCRGKLMKVRFESGRSELVGDRCEECAGLWLDAGEHGALFVMLERHLPVRRIVLLAAGLLIAVAAGLLVFGGCS